MKGEWPVNIRKFAGDARHWGDCCAVVILESQPALSDVTPLSAILQESLRLSPLEPPLAVPPPTVGSPRDDDISPDDSVSKQGDVHMTTLGDDEGVLFHSVLGEAGALYEAFSAVRQARELTKAELEQFADE
eukprot:14509050-Alexandrium_andersonii.AAC.1